MALVYFLMGLLCLMLGLTLIRYVVFTAVWVTTGHSLWIFPNMMEEQVGAGDVGVGTGVVGAGGVGVGAEVSG